jgi:coenzyme F420 biosynthesis associated uncharacterized protein
VPEPISWDLAQRVAARVGGREPPSASSLYRSLQSDFEELTAEAEELVAAETGLRSLAGPARARLTDRAGWVRANIASFQRLMRPITDRLGPRLADSPLATVGRAVTGVQIGSLLGWMSTRVLGQYDLLLVEEENPHDQDLVYYVGPNILALEKRFGFPPREFRLWLALHEVTHRTQFTGVAWMRPHFLGLVDKSLSVVDPDPRRLLDAIGRAIEIVRDGRNPLSDGILALIATPEQRATLDEVQALMSLLEGHGDVTMDRAGGGRVPSSDRFSQILRQRRAEQRGAVKLLQQAIGLEAKLRQYEQGERFIRMVEEAGGRELFARVWEGPENLPSADEIREPARWVERMGATTGVAALGLGSAGLGPPAHGGRTGR